MRVSLAIYDQWDTIDLDMYLKSKICTPVVAAFLLVFAVFAQTGPVLAQTAKLDSLFQQLQSGDQAVWMDAQTRIERIWSHSGSEAMDLLLARGRRAIQAGDYAKAVEHLTALVERAPDFAEGWNARATAFFMMGEYGLAAHDIHQTLRLNSRNYGAMAGLGMIFEELDQPKKALAAFRAALAVHPHRPDLLQAVKRLKSMTEGNLI